MYVSMYMYVLLHKLSLEEQLTKKKRLVLLLKKDQCIRLCMHNSEGCD